jgi:hypothetical protein
MSFNRSYRNRRSEEYIQQAERCVFTIIESVSRAGVESIDSASELSGTEEGGLGERLLWLLPMRPPNAPGCRDLLTLNHLIMAGQSVHYGGVTSHPATASPRTARRRWCSNDWRPPRAAPTDAAITSSHLPCWPTCASIQPSCRHNPDNTSAHCVGPGSGTG